MPSERLEEILHWALRAAEQSREYGEAEEEWAAYLDTADRAAALLEQRAACRRMYCYDGCAVTQLRASDAERIKRNGCFFPLCLISAKPIRTSQKTGRV